MNKSNGLNNGDVITVTITSANEDAYKLDFLETYGVMPESISKDYTVEGLDYYVTSLDQVPEEVLAEMKQTALDDFASQETIFLSEWTMQDPEYIGSYLLAKKSSDNVYAYNYLYLIYHVTLDYKSGNNTGTYDYYYGFYFSNLKVNGDGSFEANITYHQKVQDQLHKEMVRDGYNGTYLYTFSGYETMDDLINKNITSKAASYTIETDIR